MAVVQNLNNLAGSAEERAELLLETVAPILPDMVCAEENISRILSSRHAYFNTLAQHIERFKGKRLRPAVLLLSSRAFGRLAPTACELAALVEIIHLATLCHDDILDDAATRRNVPTLNASWGNKVAVLTGDLLLSRAFEQLGQMADPRPFRLLARISRLVCDGELLQIANRFNVNLDEAGYLELIEHKTAVLFGAAAELGALLSGASDEDSRRMYSYGRRLGIGFQVVDDCLDLVGVEKNLGKSLGSDFKNGELTLPVIHLLAHVQGAPRQKLEEMFKPDSGALTREFLLPLLEAHGSIEYALQFARQEIACAKNEIEFLPQSSSKTALLKIPDYVLERTLKKA